MLQWGGRKKEAGWNTMKYKLVIFDLDGTILNTLDDLADSTNFALMENGLPARTVEQVRCFVGNGIRKLIERAVPKGSSEELIDRVHKSFTEHYRVHCADKTKPYEGIVDVIKALRKAGLKTAVVSNKADYGVQTLCGDYFPEMFDFAVGERQNIRRKPCPDSVNEVLGKLDVGREDAVYIGDSDVDIETAKNAGIFCISVTWGFRDREFLESHGGVRFVDKPEELYKEICGTPMER